jgi:two-component system, OmpR family, response regulator CpxR
MDETLERILVIDDDRELCALLAEYLKPNGFEVEEAYDGEEGIEMALSRKYCLLVLDVMLPGRLNGFNILQYLHARTAVPILMLSARGDEVDRIDGLEMGADDYLPKPFNPKELLARIRTILRRSKSGTEEMTEGAGLAGGPGVRFKVGDVELDYGNRIAYCANEPVELTTMEFNLLEVLLQNAGQVMARDKLARCILDRTFLPYDRSIDVHVSKLRKKLGRRRCGMERIKTIRGAGYFYTLSPSSESDENDSSCMP